MSECINQLTLKDVILKAIGQRLESFREDYDFETYEEQNPYGDTWVTTSEEITDESWERSKEEFIEQFDVEEFITEYLVSDEDFKSLIMEMVENERY